jgi:NitT/TauT family transport system ATP-binding protein
MSPHPGQVKAELNSLPRSATHGDAARELERKIHAMLFAEPVESEDEFHA